MQEYGIFNDEGMIESGFYTTEEAQSAAEQYDEDEEAYVAEVCEYHEGQEKAYCEKCLK